MIVTLSLEGAVQERFEALRRRWFPADRNVVPAHVTLFHALPDEDPDGVVAALRGERFEVGISGVVKLGHGVAFSVVSAELARRRAAVARHYAGRLTRQDGAPFRPHITVQNKVTAEAAQALHAQLAAGFAPERTQAASFHLWRYLGGPWEELMTVELLPHRGTDA